MMGIYLETFHSQNVDHLKIQEALWEIRSLQF